MKVIRRSRSRPMLRSLLSRIMRVRKRRRTSPRKLKREAMMRRNPNCPRKKKLLPCSRRNTRGNRMGTSAQYEARLFGLKKDWVKNWEEKAAEKKAEEQQAKENETDGKAVEDKASGVGKGVKCTGAEETTLAGKGLEGKALDADEKAIEGKGPRVASAVQKQVKDAGAQLTTVNGDNHIDINDSPSRENRALSEDDSETKGAPLSTPVEQPLEVSKLLQTMRPKVSRRKRK